MSIAVQILDITQIKLPAVPPPPPPPPHPVKLSFFDIYWMSIPPVQKLLLYSKPATTTTDYSSLVEALKTSLSSILLDFLPLAGKLNFIPTTGDVEIDVSHPSVTFTEAESTLDLQHLAANEVHDIKSFMKLVPEIDVTAFPFSAFAVQLTRFGCGGVAIGYSFHHGVVDGKGVHDFMEAWASGCRAKLGGFEPSVSHEHRSNKNKKPTLYDRTVIQHYHCKGDEITREMATGLLSTQSTSTGGGFSSSLNAIKERRLGFSRRTFVLDAPSIQYLKQRGVAATDYSQPPSTFIAISAYTWACYARAKTLDPNLETVLAFPMDCRTRMNPPLEEGYFANCLRPVLTRMLVSELINGEGGLIKACTKIRKSVFEAVKEPLSGCENWVGEIKAVPSDRTCYATASPRFRVYDTDFGWGRPVRYESVSMNHDGEFALVGGREEGTVQVSVVVIPNQMETFGALFLAGLSRSSSSSSTA